MNNGNWFSKSISDIFEEFHSGEHGLSEVESAKRLQEYGLNILPEKKTDNYLIIFLRQFQSPLIYILFAASAIVFATGEATDSYIIIFVLLFNAIVGTIQEGRAQNTLTALKKFVETNANVLRDGDEMIIADVKVVPGDILIIQEGERIPADARVIFSSNLKIDEASLTGESVSVHKTPDVIRKSNLEVQEQKNMVFQGTHVMSGNGKAIVVQTGQNTVIGNIAKEIALINTEIPLKNNIKYLSRLIIVVVSVISLALFIAGIAADKPAEVMFATVVSLVVSIIPEGLPIVMTLVLAAGVWRMAKRNALVKKLQAVEALGQARIIAVDKTGTITKNELVVQKVYVDRKLFRINGVGYKPKGEVSLLGNIIDPPNHPELIFAGKISSFSSKAKLFFYEEQSEWHISGDPTEAAMLVFAEKIGFHKEDLERESPLITETPFDYKLKYHATVHEIEGEKLLVVSGAPETILDLSKKIWLEGKNHELTAPERNKLESVLRELTGEGLRVVALSVNSHPKEAINPEDIGSLTFVGFFGMKDALRPEVSEAMRRATNAGIRVVMITGDHKITAKAIASEAGIYRDGDEVLTGQDIDSLTDSELRDALIKVSVFARVTPEHKLRIIKAYKGRGEIVAMTGDGVNDAPSLVAADLGIAMGKIGTEVAKEAADIVLLDDNFGSIVSAIEEGRSIYKTIKKVILYLFSTSIGEVLTIGGSFALGLPLPVLPAQIIWLNLVTDGFLDVALAMEPKEAGLLNENFERPKRYLIDKKMALRMVFMSIPMMIGTLFLFKSYLAVDLVRAWTIALTTLAVFQWFNAWNCRSENRSVFQMNPFSNKSLVGATIIIITLHLFAIYNPLMQKLLHTTPLAFYEWLIIIPTAFSIIIIEEVRKYFDRLQKNL